MNEDHSVLLFPKTKHFLNLTVPLLKMHSGFPPEGLGKWSWGRQWQHDVQGHLLQKRLHSQGYPQTLEEYSK